MAAKNNAERENREARDRLRRYNARQTVHETQISRRKRDNLVAIGAVIVVVAIAVVAQLFYFTAGPGVPTPEPTPSATPTPTETPSAGQNVGDVPDPSVAEGRTWTGELGINGIPLGISLDGALAPQAVASFVTSAADGYYVDKTCHRLVVSDSASLLQCGSLTGDGLTDTSYSFGPVENAAADQVYPAGTLAMARAADNAYSFGRQFFIVFEDSALPNDSVGGYSIIGQVTSGLDELAAAQLAGGVVDGEPDGAPVIPTSITSLTVQ